VFSKVAKLEKTSLKSLKDQWNSLDHRAKGKFRLELERRAEDA
jgi:hypothetical protein